VDIENATYPKLGTLLSASATRREAAVTSLKVFFGDRDFGELEADLRLLYEPVDLAFPMDALPDD